MIDTICFQKTKKFLLVILIMSNFGYLKSQTSFPKDSIFNRVDSLPEFHGGVSKLDDYIKKNLYKYISKFKIESYKQVIWVIFIVEKDGSLSNLTCYPDSLEFSKGILNFINSMPKWNPGIYRNQIVRTRVILPISLDMKLLEAPKKIQTEDLAFFSLNYQSSSFLGSISNFLEPESGFCLEVGFTEKYDSEFRFGAYGSFLQPQIKKSFNRNEAFWEKSRYSNLIELGGVLNYRLFAAKNTEMLAFSQLGFNYHTPSKHRPGDLIGIRNTGFSGGLGTNFFYFFNPKADPHKIAVNLKWKIQYAFLDKNLKGGVFNLNGGLVYFFY